MSAQVILSTELKEKFFSACFEVIDEYRQNGYTDSQIRDSLHTMFCLVTEKYLEETKRR